MIRRKGMIMKRIVGILAVIILVSGITGCAIGNKGTMHYNRTTTIGKELLDLKEAKDKGALSEEEYNKVKEDLLKSGSIKIECLYDNQDKSSED
jgi:uncharacterized membrane protein